MPIALERGEQMSLIRLEGAIDISCAHELKALLIEALGRGRKMRLSLDGATDLDRSAVQLLWAAAGQARGTGAGFALPGPAPERVWAAMAAAGIQES